MAWTEEQLANARVIYNVGLEVGASMRDIQAAIMAAIVESGLRNLNYGDRDSIGLFQQRDAWGTSAARLNPYTAAKMFFTGGNGGQPGLLDIANRNQMTLGDLAQTVQVSAYPDRYAEHQAEAEKILARVGSGDGLAGTLGAVVDNPTDPANLPKLDPTSTTSTVPEVNAAGEVTADSAGIGALTFGIGGTAPESGSPVDALTFGMQSPDMADPMAKLHAPDLSQLTTGTSVAGDVASGWRAQVVAAARKMLGTPYVWGGTSYSGVDCSGLVSLLYNNRGFSLPRLSADQARSGMRVDLNALKPGDLVAWDNSSRNHGADHIAIYIGNGQIIEAPRPGGVVQISNLYDTADAWGVALHR